MISASLWIEVQTALASAFMVPAMWRVWQVLRVTEGADSTAAQFPRWMAVHGVFGMIVFTAMAVAAYYAEPRIPAVQYAAWLIATATVPLMLVKSRLTWLAEARGTTRLWRFYVALSVIWAAAAVIF